MMKKNKRSLEKECSVCGAQDRVAIETVTNVAPKRDEMYPVILCAKHKAMLSKGELDIRMDANNDLVFVDKKKK